MKLTAAQLEELRTDALRGARHFKAAGKDVPPALLVYNARPDGRLGELHIIALMGGTKDQWAALQQKQARSPEVAAAVLVIECWSLIQDRAAAALAAGAVPDSIAAHPGRTEALLVSVMTREEQHIGFATITGKTVAEFELRPLSPDGPARMTGRFVRESAR